MLNTLVFLWIQSQSFYKELQNNAIKSIPSTNGVKTWADIGCSVGLLSREARKLNYIVTGYDINYFSLLFARILSFNVKQLNYKQEGLFSIQGTFDIVSATSLLSVLDNKKEALEKLISLLKNKDSTLILIEPTEKLTLQNTKKLIVNFKTFWFYKGLLLWAKARENKAVDTQIFNNLEGFKVSTKDYLQGMIHLSLIQRVSS